MKGKWVLIGILILGPLWVLHASSTLAQKTPRSLTVLYSNNLNGEIDPCPT